MKIFDNYSNFYDSYYKTKAYDKEVDFILRICEQYSKNKISSILDVGCGTGGHLIPLAKKGYNLKGIDLSEKMIEIAKKKIKKLKLSNISLATADASKYKNDEKYDLILAMFAVMGFITSENALKQALINIRHLLKLNGLFIFDVWFGPAVLSTLPSTRVSEFKLNNTKVIRIVEPIKIDIFNDIITTKNSIIQLKNGKTYNHFSEIHQIKYYFQSSFKQFFEQTNLKLLKICPFMDESRDATIDDWNVTFIVQAI